MPPKIIERLEEPVSFSNSAYDENKVPRNINDADNLEDLFRILNAQPSEVQSAITKNINMSDRSTPNISDLHHVINNIKDGVYPLETLTRQYDLRATVGRLLEKESNNAIIDHGVHIDLISNAPDDEDLETHNNATVIERKREEQARIRESLANLTDDSGKPNFYTTHANYNKALKAFNRFQRDNNETELKQPVPIPATPKPKVVRQPEKKEGKISRFFQRLWK